MNYNSNRNALRELRISRNLCRDCGLIAPQQNKVICIYCHNKRTEYLKQRREKQKQNNICYRCNKPSDNVSLCKSCMNNQQEEMRQRRKYVKETIVNYFGNKCYQCTENHIACLTLDHINNDGNIDQLNSKGKRIGTTQWYARLLGYIENLQFEKLKHLQLLCFNCHAKKDLMPWWMKDIDNDAG